MTRTPRNVLEARASEGNWAAFPVSPAPYFARLRAIYQHGYADYRGVGLPDVQGPAASTAGAGVDGIAGDDLTASGGPP